MPPSSTHIMTKVLSIIPNNCFNQTILKWTIPLNTFQPDFQNILTEWTAAHFRTSTNQFYELGMGHYLCRGGGVQKRRGVKAISNWLEGSAKRFYKEVYGGQQFDHEVYKFKEGSICQDGKGVK